MTCTLVDRGETIQLNAIGQCDTMEARDAPAVSLPTTCQQPGCTREGAFQCEICSMRLCLPHTHFYPNLTALMALDERERAQPGSITPGDVHGANTPLCHAHFIQYAPVADTAAESGYTPWEELDDGDEPD